MIIKQQQPFIKHLLCASYFTGTLAGPQHNPTRELYNLSQEADSLASGHTTSMWWSQDWGQLGQTFARLSCGLWAGSGYPGEKGQGKARGSIEEKGVDAFVFGSQRQR